MRILLTNLPTHFQVIDLCTPDYVIDDFSIYPPLGLLYIAVDVEKKHELKILDVTARNYTIEQIHDEIEHFDPDILGISTVTRRLYSMTQIAKEAKKRTPKVKVVVGGPHTNIYPRETAGFEFVDYVLNGYCEYTFSRLVKAIDNGEHIDALSKIENLYYTDSENKLVETAKGGKPIVLDKMPFPDRALINLEDYFTVADKTRMTTINSSRGCPYQCVFCDVQDKKYHYRSADNLLDEIEKIVELGIDEIHIFDDTFNANRKRVIQFCEGIIDRKLKIKWSARVRAHPLDEEMLILMKKSGCFRLHIGVESGNPKILSYINKKITKEQIENAFRLCRKFKIKTLAYFIIGFPDQTLKECRYERDFITSIKPTYILATVLYALPGSRFYEYLLREKLYEKDYWREFACNPTQNFVLPVWREPDIEGKLPKILDEIYKGFYLSPRFVINDLIHNFNAQTLYKKIALGVKLLLKS